jgi:hypothetical protein
VYPNGERTSRKEWEGSAIKTPKELCVSMLSELRHGAERSQKIYEELGEAAQNPEIKEALDARELVSSQILNRLDECFRLIGEKPAKVNQRLHEVFIEDFRRELNENPGFGRPQTLRPGHGQPLGALAGSELYHSDRGS